MKIINLPRLEFELIQEHDIADVKQFTLFENDDFKYGIHVENNKSLNKIKLVFIFIYQNHRLVLTEECYPFDASENNTMFDVIFQRMEKMIADLEINSMQEFYTTILDKFNNEALPEIRKMNK